MEQSPTTTRSIWQQKSALLKRMGVMLSLVGLLALIVIGYQIFMGMEQQRTMLARISQPQTVSAMPVQVQSWTPRVSAVGTLKAVNGADLALEVPGIVDDIHFQSGDDVESGEIILRLRADDEIAKLRSLEATERLAALTYSRAQELVKSRAVSQATLDTNKANLTNTRAQVAQQRAILEKKTIRAPFSGRLGVSSVDKGQYLNAGNSVVTLQALDPIYVDFFVPQQELNRLKPGQSVQTAVDTYPEDIFNGTITAVDPKVDASNRNVRVRAIIENNTHKLFPGMYATVEVDAGNSQKVLAVPQIAVIYNAYGNTIFLLDDEGQDTDGEKRFKARQEFITLGETRGDMVSVSSGIEAGEIVVTAGNTKLRHGSLVRIDNTIETPMETSPVIIDP
ncbi:MAG: efflux transporter periplasmic adaptor subunit [Candidatus Marinimicrobia bacterium]|nr:efflux transporter periplasmic adaptor subunit [Candidatus Neomarinimicrobiota bacterium]